MNRKLLAACLIILLTACATPQPVSPVKPAGPSAVLFDSAVGGGRDGAAFFIVEEINGSEVTRNSLKASVALSAGRGADMRIAPVYRYAPAGKSKLRIAGRHAYAAPIQSLLGSAASNVVSGAIEVELRPDVNYRVKGNLDAFRREVWLVEEATGVIVGEKIVSKEQSPEWQKAMAGASYACCNLRYDGDWINDNNPMPLPFVPAGARVAIREYGSNRVHVYVEGRPMRIGLDYGRKQESIKQFIEKLLVKDDPGIRMASYPANIQRAIQNGKISVGMTREQVIMSLGYPRADATAVLSQSEWKYWTNDDDEFFVVWGDDGRLRDVKASPKVKAIAVDSEK